MQDFSGATTQTVTVVPPSGTSPTAQTQVTGLQRSTPYYFRALARNDLLQPGPYGTVQMAEIPLLFQVQSTIMANNYLSIAMSFSYPTAQGSASSAANPVSCSQYLKQASLTQLGTGPRVVFFFPCLQN